MAVSIGEPMRGYLVVSLDDRRYALPIGSVERVVRAVALTPLPHAPAIVLGVIDVAGRAVPVVSLRRRFGLRERAVIPDDHYVLVETGTRRLALTVDDAGEVVEQEASGTTSAHEIAGAPPHVAGTMPGADGLVVIHDIARCLGLDEELALAAALREEASRAP